MDLQYIVVYYEIAFILYQEKTKTVKTKSDRIYGIDRMTNAE